MWGQSRSEGLAAIKFIKNVGGVSGAVMVQASDQHYYVIKSPINLQHRRIVINEFIAAGLAQLVGLPTPPPMVIHVPRDLVPVWLDSGPESQPRRRKAVFDGLCFASRLPVDANLRAIYDLVPKSLLEEVANKEVALGCWLFDAWTSNADGVQVVFHRARKRRRLPGHYWLTKIDHGFCFQAHNWEFFDGQRHMAFWQLPEAAKVKCLFDLEPYLTRIQVITVERVLAIVRQVPGVWLGPGEEAKLEQLATKLVGRVDTFGSRWTVWWPTEQIERHSGLRTRIRWASASANSAAL